MLAARVFWAAAMRSHAVRAADSFSSWFALSRKRSSWAFFRVRNESVRDLAAILVG